MLLHLLGVVEGNHLILIGGSVINNWGAYGIRLGNVGLEESLHFIGYQIVGLMAVYNVLFAGIVCKMYVSLLEDNLYKVFLLIVPEAWEASF